MRSRTSFIGFLRQQAGDDTIVGQMMNEIASNDDAPRSRVTYKKMYDYLVSKGADKAELDALYKAWRRFARIKGIRNTADARESVTS